ncbi:MAG: DUF4129 domain-containing protein [Labilithrix sp.]|nr:DUF4129 domain-containing protein [Labilithrix sp.]MCW5815620.1 DUF4129 domain-containing protein [Labilithrix sp.]
MSAKATLRRTWPVLLSYAVFSMWGVACFMCALVLGTGGFGLQPGAWGILAGILGAVAIGHLAGNALGLAGFRLVPITAIFFLLLIGGTWLGIALGPVVLFLWIAVIAAYGGYLGIASRLDVVASWYPLMFCVGGAIVWMNTHGAVKTFDGGSKHMVWDAFTIICLAGGVFWMLVFLATRNALGLTVWQEVARPRAAEQPDVAVARPGRGSILVLMGFTLAVLGATALVSPYLFRTKEPDCKEEDGKVCYKGDSGGQGQGEGEGESDGKDLKGAKAKGKGKSVSKGSGSGSGGKGRGRGQGGKGEGADGDPMGEPDTDGASEAAAEAAKLGLNILLWLLVTAAILLFLYLVVLPPIRRAFLLKHLEKPLWPVAPTARVMNHWRRALAILAVAGIEPSAGETATDFAARAEKELKDTLGCDAPGLADAATIVEKIAFAGRGLGTADEQAVRDAVATFIGAVRPHLKLKSRLAAAWGRAPEVEA